MNYSASRCLLLLLTVAGCSSPRPEPKIERYFQSAPETEKSHLAASAEQPAKEQFYYLFGDVRSPGRKPFNSPTTVLDVLCELDYLPPQLVLSRRIGPKPRDAVSVVVDVKLMYLTGDMKQNYLLRPEDMVWVPCVPAPIWRWKPPRP